MGICCRFGDECLLRSIPIQYQYLQNQFFNTNTNTWKFGIFNTNTNTGQNTSNTSIPIPGIVCVWFSHISLYYACFIEECVTLCFCSFNCVHRLFIGASQGKLVQLCNVMVGMEGQSFLKELPICVLCTILHSAVYRR